ncbi:MAG: hypothetical protein ACUVS2_11605 [Candidatus Flexifilum sp.]|jgi:NAD(P)-dependent dehydrogenase (short-subunit alcohol dehydrogenase family)
MTERIAVVTGANRDIGLDVCRQLAKRWDRCRSTQPTGGCCRDGQPIPW